jgi:hypothetical protein
MIEYLMRIFNKYVLIAGFSFACILTIFTGAAFMLLQPEVHAKPAGTALLNILMAPTDTEVLPSPLPSVTPTLQPGTPMPPPPGVINIGSYVQVQGTGTDGLRFRNEPGFQGTIQFVAIEAEVFRVVDGPREVDGYTWWFLAAPYDENVRGWCVSNYLQIVQTP